MKNKIYCKEFHQKPLTALLDPLKEILQDGQLTPKTKGRAQFLSERLSELIKEEQNEILRKTLTKWLGMLLVCIDETNNV